ncbi:MAG: sigma-70 region 4 domain-containing protein [Candidatus Altiarchaeota archaeon]|nr:sigma-70 region 4 domain-containing protein [Candidatus Altiarchaeota archaeon]MBU4406560.1 sigma-70 region 4 domain-containing protein [Candidatus Altiarchaeota archaeon]
MVSDYHLAQIVELRGLGYKHREIAKKLGLKETQVSYWLGQVRKEANEKGNDPTYVKIMSAGILPEIVRLLGGIGKFVK